MNLFFKLGGVVGRWGRRGRAIWGLGRCGVDGSGVVCDEKGVSGKGGDMRNISNLRLHRMRFIYT